VDCATLHTITITPKQAPEVEELGAKFVFVPDITSASL
jgi:hypothetical protein